MEKPFVLVVEDEPLIAAMVELTFMDAGFEVCLAASAAEAEEQQRQLGSNLAALVTDIRLGDGPDGWSIASGARTRLPLLPIVYMTGDSASDWTAFGVPGSILIQKPFVGAQVLAAVIDQMNADGVQRE